MDPQVNAQVGNCASVRTRYGHSIHVSAHSYNQVFNGTGQQVLEFQELTLFVLRAYVAHTPGKEDKH